MDKQGRISRRERQKLHGDFKTWIALVLAIIVFALIIDRLGEFKIGALIWPSEFGKIDFPKYLSLADSTIMTTIESFQLTDKPKMVIPGTDPDTSIKVSSYHRISQSWPQGIAFIYFVRRLRDSAFQSNLGCDCMESENGGSLKCNILKGSAIVSQVSLKADENTRLLNRKVAIVFENLAKLRESDLLQIINGGLIFSYISTPDIFPSNEIRRIMSNSGVTTIISVPANRKDWIREAPQIVSEAGSHGTIDGALFGELLDKYPNPHAVEFDYGNGLDTLVVSQIIEVSRRKNLAYLYSNFSPNFADSLAYLMGMKVIKLEIMTSGSVAIFSEIEEKIMDPGVLWEINLKIDPNSMPIISLLSLKSRCDKLGIKLVSFMELAKSLESL